MCGGLCVATGRLGELVVEEVDSDELAFLRGREEKLVLVREMTGIEAWDVVVRMTVSGTRGVNFGRVCYGGGRRLCWRLGIGFNI